jgi:hypothetical protein
MRYAHDLSFSKCLTPRVCVLEWFGVELKDMCVGVELKD